MQTKTLSSVDASKAAAKKQQPKALPTFRWRPDLLNGIPMRRDSFALAPEIPIARFHENEKPYFLPIYAPPKPINSGHTTHNQPVV